MKTLHKTLDDLYKYIVEEQNREKAMHAFQQHMAANERFHTDLDALQVALRKLSRLVRITFQEVLLVDRPGVQTNWHQQNIKMAGEEIKEAKMAVRVIKHLTEKLARDERLIE